MKLEDIGFYTLSDERAKNACINSQLYRCELIVTDRCNFKCPYCRGPKQKRDPVIDYDKARYIINLWASEGLQNIRFSGGEPTLYKHLPELILLSKSLGIKRIAISTNGSRDLSYYKYLIECGVNDFSISLDSCCSSGVKQMSGGVDVWETLIRNISELAKITYVAVGMVFDEHNVDKARDSVLFAYSLGVSDIRVISSAQFNTALSNLTDLTDDILGKLPILSYRVNNFRLGKNVRGISSRDSKRCKLVLDDMAVAGDKHYPCIIYLREGGKHIGNIGYNMREERLEWSNNHNTHKDPICYKNCLDVCIDYNNKACDRRPT